MKALVFGVVCLTCAAAVPPAAADDELSRAKDLYASAAYEDALATLSHVQEGGDQAPAEVQEYRAFCLFALGRTNEAETVAEALLTKNPLLQLDTRDASPRITAMFGDVRRRVLPKAIRERYKSARAAMDRKDYAAAAPELAEVRRMLDEADRDGAKDETLADLRVLVDGFSDLAKSETERAAAAQTAAADTTPPAVKPAAPRAVDSSVAGIKPPVTVRQDMPAIPPALVSIMERSPKSGLVDIEIDEQGSVDRVVVRESVNAVYDRMLIAAARGWKYLPATRDGKPVRFVKTVVVAVR